MTSPLSKVVRDPRINQILGELRQSARDKLPIQISPEDIDYIQSSFRAGLLLGEKKLVQLAQHVMRVFWVETSYEAQLVAQGRCRRQDHEGVIMGEENIFPAMATVLETPDTILADRYAPRCPKCEARCLVIKSFVRWTQDRDTDNYLRYFSTRIKTTSNICYKIADMVFDIDFMFQRDKIYNEFSQMVTDVYGVKAVVKEKTHIEEFMKKLFSSPGVELIERKDYTGEKRKRSGFEAFKVVISRDRHLFEVQVQSEEMFAREMTVRSALHRTYKEHQMDDRSELGDDYISLYKTLSRLFSSPADRAIDEMPTEM